MLEGNVPGDRGICPLSSSPHGAFRQFMWGKLPIFKENANARGLARGGGWGGVGWGGEQLELTDA